MSKVSGVETKPEITVRKFLFSKGLRFLKNDKRYPGKPDIVLPKYDTIIFIHGCFWHGHQNCKHSKMPKTNIEYWTKKIQMNVQRDHKNIKTLKKLGWHVIVVWTCKIENTLKRNKNLNFLLNKIKNPPAKNN